MLGERKVITTAEIETSKNFGIFVEELNIDNIFEQFYQRICSKSEGFGGEIGDQFQISIHTLNGKELAMWVNSDTTVETLKSKILNETQIPVDQQRLNFQGKQLEDQGTMDEYGIKGDDVVIPTLHLVVRLRGGGFAHYYMSPEYFDPQFNVDFQQIKNDGTMYFRGTHVYKRPYGSMRYAIKVLGKYPDDLWLGSQGNRTGADPREWPVAYHGTLEMNAVGIVENGFSLDKGRRFLFGKGIYATPNPQAALDYSAVYNFRGKKFKLIMQTRVDPSKLKVMKTYASNPNHAKYWLLPDSDAIRPYGICVYEIKN